MQDIKFSQLVPFVNVHFGDLELLFLYNTQKHNKTKQKRGLGQLKKEKKVGKILTFK